MFLFVALGDFSEMVRADADRSELAFVIPVPKRGKKLKEA
jgi:hypothetical protein